MATTPMSVQDAAGAAAAQVAPQQSQMAQDPSTMQPTQMGAPTQPAPPEKPSLWKSVVAGALAGLANSSGATSFGGGLGRGAAGALAAQQKQKDDTASAASDAQTASDAHQKAQVQNATAYANLAEINKRVSLLPPDHQTEVIEKEADNTAAEQKTGEIGPAGQPVADWHDAQNQATQLMQQNPSQLFIPKPVKGPDGKVQYQVFAANDALTMADATVEMPDGKTVTVPKGSVTGKQLQQFRIGNLTETVKNHTQAAAAKMATANAAQTRANAAQTAANNKASTAQSNTAEWKPKVTADEKKKAELAENMAHNAEGVAAILQRRSDLFGPAAGRFTTVQQMIGTNDPDISSVGNMIHNYAMANSGIHGFRSQEGVRDTEQQILNSFKNGPKAVGAALLAGVSSGQTFIDNARPETYKTHTKAGGVLKGMRQ